MAGVRRLFINNNGFDKFTENVFSTRESMKDEAFADIIECREYVMKQFKLASKLPKVSSISLTEDGEIRIRTRDLFISNSETGILRKFFVGKWKVTIALAGEYRFYPLNKNELEYDSGVWGSGTVHPHISGRSHQGCLGSAATPLQLYLKAGDIKTLVIYVLGYLESVNIDDAAGSELGYCKEVALDEEGNVLHDEDGNYKFKSNEFDREHHYRIATTVSSNVDLIHHEYITVNYRKCDMCGHTFNASYTEILEDGECVCKDCSKDMKRCAICNKLTGKVVHDNINDMDYCENCATNYFGKCSYCDDYIFKPLDKEDIMGSIIKLTRESEKKNNYLLVKTSTDNGMHTKRVCDACKDIIEQDKLPVTKMVNLKRIKIENPMAEVLTDIPFNKFREKCDGCSILTPVESLVMSDVISKNIMCSSNMHAPTDYYIQRSFSWKLYDRYLKDNYIKIFTSVEDNEVTIHVAPYNNAKATLLPRAAFKDKDVWGKIKVDDVIKYKMEGRE